MSLRKNAKIELIRQAPLFSQCSKRELAQVASLADEVSLRKGRVLIREGARGRECFVLIEGTVDVHRKGRKIATMGPGDLFGEMALISDAPRNATVTATSPVRTLVITSRAFKSLLERSPRIHLKVLQGLVERLPASTP